MDISCQVQEMSTCIMYTCISQYKMSNFVLHYTVLYSQCNIYLEEIFFFNLNLKTVWYFILAEYYFKFKY